MNLLDELLELAGCNEILDESVADIKIRNAPSMSIQEFRKAISYDPYLYQFLSLNDNELGQKSNSYLKWIISHWNELKTKSNDLVKNLLSDFDSLKNTRGALENNDINFYSSIEELKSAIEQGKQTHLSLSQQQRKARNASRNADSDVILLCSGDIYNMYYPKTYAASVKLGKNTHWCTATNSDDEYYEEYSELGPLFIFINKENTNEKYQLWYSESGKSVSTYDGTHTLHDQNNDIESNSLYDILKDEKIYDYLHNNSKITPYLKKYWPNVMKTSYDELENYDLNSFEYIIDSLNVKYDIDNNGNYIIADDLDLSDTDITSLPDNLKVDGSLNLSGTKIASLPDNLKVDGSLNLSGTKIASLPDNLQVGGGLNLSVTNITSLPDNLKVGSWLYLSVTKIASLPDNFKVDDDLDLSYTKITSLPNNLQVGGGLDLRGTEITSLPDNLQVGGDLDLSHTKITSLPNNLQVGGDLDLRGTEITSLPDNLKVGGEIFTY